MRPPTVRAILAAAGVALALTAVPLRAETGEVAPRSNSDCPTSP